MQDRIVAEFGDGYDVEGIASRHGLTVAQVYAVVEREVGAADQGHPGPPSPYPPTPGYYAPPPAAGHHAPPPGHGCDAPAAYPAQPPGPGHYPPPAYAAPGYAAPPQAGQGQSHQPSQGFADDVIVAEYGEGYDVEAIARKHGISVERVYEVVQRVVGHNRQPPAGPTPSW